MDVTTNTVSTVEAAEILGYTRHHVYRLLWTGELRGRRIGRCWFIPIDAVSELKSKQAGGRLPRQ